MLQLTIRRRLFLCLVTAALLLPALPGLALDSVSIQVSPASTWKDPVSLTLSGRTLGVVEASAPMKHAALGGGFLVDVVLTEIATPGVPGPPQPFAIHVDLGYLFPGHYTFRVASSEQPETYLASAQLHLFNALNLEITPAKEPPSDTAPFEFRIAGYSSCGVLGEPTVHGTFIDVKYSDICPFLPADPAYSEQTFQVGPLPAGDYLIRAIESNPPVDGAAVRRIRVYDSTRCVPSPTVLCLNGDRFRVQATWKDFQGGEGVGHAVPLPERDDTGLLWFFNPANVELTVKVLDGCKVNGHYWVFVSSGSTVEYEITVTDLDADQSRVYGNDSGDTPALIPDTTAFATCP